MCGIWLALQCVSVCIPANSFLKKSLSPLALTCLVCIPCPKCWRSGVLAILYYGIHRLE